MGPKEHSTTMAKETPKETADLVTSSTTQIIGTLADT